jgi:putative membrane protein
MTLATFTLIAPAIALGHPESATLTRAEAEHTWTLEPLVLALLLFSALLFYRGAIRRWRRPGWSPWHVLAFTVGWITLFVSLVSPVHKLGSMLFWVHMTQHELLMIVAAPLLVLARPLIYFLWSLPFAWRERLGRLSKQRTFAATWSFLTGALFVWALHAVTIWGWHIPVLYQASVENEFVHGLQHTMFLVTALLFWWTLIHGRYGRMGYGIAVMYVFTTAVHTSILGALMTFARNVWYPIYDGRTAAFSLTALQDQQIGGLVMWIPAGTVFIVLGLAMLAAWIGESERRVAISRVADLRTNDLRTNAGVLCATVSSPHGKRGTDAA